MPVSHAHRFIFVHVPKTAGSSVRRALAAADPAMQFDGKAFAEPDSPNEPVGSGKQTSPTVFLHHFTAVELRPLVGEGIWESYFKFTFVRNPWDRMVSFYHFHKARLERPGVREARPELAAIYDRAHTFEDWLRVATYVAPCSDFLFDNAGNSLVNFIGRFENLEKDFATICQRVGIEGHLPHLMGSNHTHYRHYYTDDTAELVTRQFETDISRFGYVFGAE